MIQSEASSNKRALYVGRFQPFHRGHLHAISTILHEIHELIVGVATIDKNFSLTDPFTSGERLEMICASLPKTLRARCLILPITEITNNSLWVPYVLSLVPRFDLAYTNNPLQATLMTAAHIPVRPIELLHRDQFQGNVIRIQILENDPRWRNSVPSPAAAILDRIDAEKRLHMLESVAGTQRHVAVNS